MHGYAYDVPSIGGKLGIRCLNRNLSTQETTHLRGKTGSTDTNQSSTSGNLSDNFVRQGSRKWQGDRDEDGVPIDADGNVVEGAW